MGDRWRRIRAIARKDAEEVRSQPALLLPAAAMVLGLAVPALVVLLAIPRLTGESLAEAGFTDADAAAAAMGIEAGRLTEEGLAQAFLLQQFLVFSLLVPVMGSLSLASQGIIGEKQARALEPMLATPIRTGELLAGKVVTPFVLSMALLASTFLLYLVAMGVWGEPGVWRTLLGPRTLLLYLVLGPLVSLAGLFAAAIISSRVNDARTAQQWGGLLVLPMTALFVAQLTGQFLLGTGALLVTALVLAVVCAALLAVGVRVFQRETILMRWK
ncbi:MAG: ABC transporter permease subunit [Vicinamibacterales bacterium]